MLAGVCIVAIDRPLARWLATIEPSPAWDRGVEVLEWAVGLPVFKLLAPVALVVGMLVTMIVPRLRVHAPAWIVVAGTHVFARYVTNVVKDATGRVRPLAWIEHGGDGSFFRDGVAFPSGHVALFASLVIPLAVVAPARVRGACVGVAIAVTAFIAMARVAVDAHWLSDTLAAITLVALLTWVLGYAVRPRRT